MWFAALAALCVLLVTGGMGHAAGLTVTLDRDTITIGESATLTLTFQGGSSHGLPALPRIPNLNFSDSQGHSSQVSIVNGDVSRMESYMYTGDAHAAGGIHDSLHDDGE